MAERKKYHKCEQSAATQMSLGLQGFSPTSIAKSNKQTWLAIWYQTLNRKYLFSKHCLDITVNKCMARSTLRTDHWNGRAISVISMPALHTAHNAVVNANNINKATYLEEKPSLRASLRTSKQQILINIPSQLTFTSTCTFSSPSTSYAASTGYFMTFLITNTFSIFFQTSLLNTSKWKALH